MLVGQLSGNCQFLVYRLFALLLLKPSTFVFLNKKKGI